MAENKSTEKSADKPAEKPTESSNAKSSRKSGGEFRDLKQEQYPLTVTATDEDGREMHRTQVAERGGYREWSDLVSPDLDDPAVRPGRHKVRVEDASGEVVHEAWSDELLGTSKA